jgi:hypothetical protein
VLLNEKSNDRHETLNRTLNAARQLPSWLTFDVWAKKETIWYYGPLDHQGRLLSVIL